MTHEAWGMKHTFSAFLISHASFIILPGGMAEWSKALDSKSSRPHKGLEGSNPSPTARIFWSKATHVAGGWA